MNTYSHLYFLYLIFALFISATSSAQSLTQAKQWYQQFKPQKALSVYKAIFSDVQKEKEKRAEAGRQLSRIKWLCFGETEEALRSLEKVEKDFPEQAKTLSLWARILAAEEQYEEALAKMDAALAIENEELQDQLLEQYAEVVFQKIENSLETTQSITSADLKRLEKASNDIEQLYQSSQGAVIYARNRMKIAFFQQDYSLLFESWKHYFNISNKASIPNQLEEVYPILASIALQEKPLNPKMVEQLVEALATSGFIHLATTAIHQHQLSESKLSAKTQSILTLQNALQQINQLSNDFYQKSATGQENKSDYQKGLFAIEKELWRKLKPNESSFDVNHFRAYLQQEFGLHMRLYDNNFMGLHLGFAIRDEIIELEQYDQKAKLRYVQLDQMISNGFGTWYWDGALSHTGWINVGEAIFQVRLPLLAHKAWSNVCTEEARKKRLQTIEKNRQSDLSLVQKEPYAYQRGQLQQLRFLANQRMYDDLKTKDLSEFDLRQVFTRKFEYHSDQNVILHEARHAIDKNLKEKWKGKEFEFRAKLSEVYFNELPFFCLAYSGILSPLTGSKNANGQANLKVLKGLQKWIFKHQDSINNYNDRLPSLYQLDLLTAAQLKVAFQSMDQLAKTK